MASSHSEFRIYLDMSEREAACLFHLLAAGTSQETLKLIGLQDVRDALENVVVDDDDDDFHREEMLSEFFGLKSRTDFARTAVVHTPELGELHPETTARSEATAKVSNSKR